MHKRYDLIFMDVQMPVMDGIQAAERIRQLTFPDREPVIVAVTAFARQEDQDRCLASGMRDFISKPIFVDEIKRVLSAWTMPVHAGELKRHGLR